MDAHSGTQPTIDTALDKRRQELYQLNCKRLDAIIDCIVLCGQQNIAVRGHRDANSQPLGCNKGNFKAILEFRALGVQNFYSVAGKVYQFFENHPN